MISNESHKTWSKEVIEFTSAYYSNKAMDNYSQEDIEQSITNLLGTILLCIWFNKMYGTTCRV
jgi:hypothetical protein